MRLLNKTLLAGACALLVLIGIVCVVSSRILLGGFARVEQQEAAKDMQSTERALDNVWDSLDRTAVAWANGDDSYRFLQSRGTPFWKQFASGALNDDALAPAKSNIIVYVLNSGPVIWAKSFDTKARKSGPLPAELRTYLKPGSPLLQHPANASARGLVMLPQGPLFIVSRPVLTSRGKGPVLGSVLFGHYLDDDVKKELAHTVRRPLDWRFYSDDLDGDWQLAQAAFEKGESVFLLPQDADVLAGYTLVRDLHGKPALLARVDMPRTTFQQGQASVRHLLASLLSIGMVFGLMAMLLLNTLERSRHRQAQVGVAFGTQANKRNTPRSGPAQTFIGAGTDMTARKQDEMALREAHDELAIRVAQRTEQLARADEQSRRAKEEAERAREETERAREEVKRAGEEAEIARGEAKRARGEAERTHQGAEAARMEVEAARLKAEAARQEAEAARMEAERAREDAEHRRDSAEAANKAKSEVLLRMSYELRTPVNAVLNYGQMLEGSNLTERQSGGVGHILRAGRHLLNLLDEALDIARNGAGQPGNALAPNRIDDVVREAAELVRPLATAAKVHVHSDASFDWIVLSDPDKLKQVLVNLLSNAVQYNRPGGIVWVTCHEISDAQEVNRSHSPRGAAGDGAGRYLELRVRDTGQGIAPEDLSHLFVPSQRSGARNTLTRGTGSGLAIAKRLMELMGGSIRVESQLNQGSTFSIRLPLSASQGPESTLLDSPLADSPTPNSPIPGSDFQVRNPATESFDGAPNPMKSDE